MALSSRASQHVGHSFRSTPSPESRGSRTQEPAIEPKEKKAALSDHLLQRAHMKSSQLSRVPTL